MKRFLTAILILILISRPSAQALETYSNSEGMNSVRTKINAAILQVNTNTAWIVENSNTVGNAALLFNVRDYGALGDDSNDDTAELQAAVDAAIAAGARLYIPAGIYKITSDIQVTAGQNGSVYIFGDGEGAGNGTDGTTIIKQYTAGQNGIEIDGLTSDNGISGCVITDIVVLHEDTSNRTGKGIYVEHDSYQSSRIYLRNVSVFDFQHGIYLEFIDQSVIQNCYVTQCSYGIYTPWDHAANGLEISGGAVTACDTSSIYLGQGRGVSISGMDLGNAPTDAIISIDKNSMGINIVGCSFEPTAADSVCVRIDSEETTTSYFSAVHIAGNSFNGAFLTTTNAPIIVESKNVMLSLQANQMHRYPGATPMVRVVAGAEKAVIVGSPFYNPANPVSRHGGVYYSDGTFAQLSSIPHDRQNNERWNGQAERAGMIWYDAYSSGTTNDAEDDLQVVYLDATTGTNQFRRSSLLNDKILRPLISWATNNPASAMTDAADIPAALGALQGALNAAQPYGWETNWVEHEVAMINGTEYPMASAVEVAPGSYHLTADHEDGGGIALYLRGESVTPPSDGGELFGDPVGISGKTYKIMYRVVGTDDATYPFRLRSVSTVNGNSDYGALNEATVWSDTENTNIDSMDWNEVVFVANNGSGYDQYLQFGTITPPSTSATNITYDVIADFRVFEAQIIPVIPSSAPPALSTITFTNGWNISCTSTSIVFSAP